VPTTDALIAGAGIIGLSSALALARSGLRVTIIERARAMGEASWAAAGMLAAHDPENPPALLPLSDLSLALYPAYLADIERLSSRRVPIRTTEALQGTRPGHRFEHHLIQHLLSPAQVQSRIPGLRAYDRQFLALPEHSLDPRDLCAALPPAAIAAGVTLLEESAITALRCSPGEVEVTTTAGTFSASAFVNCAGAWAAQLAHDRTPGSLDLDALGLEPRKGQIVTVRLAEQHNLACVVRTPETYLVPRGDGRVVIGATVERAGFDKAVHADVVETLIDEAAALWPPITQSSIVETWAGLRPGSADGLPVLGTCGHPRCFIASGHFRNGILLAPATARMITQLVRGEAPDVDLTPFSAHRISDQAVRP
jgi:glycine oxidase